MKRMLLVCLLFFGSTLVASALDLSPIYHHPVLGGYAESVSEDSRIVDSAFSHMHNCTTTNGKIAAMGGVIRAQDAYISSLRRLNEQLARLVVAEGKAGPASKESLAIIKRKVVFALGVDSAKNVVRKQLQESENTNVKIGLFGTLMRISNEAMVHLQNTTSDYVMYFR